MTPSVPTSRKLTLVSRDPLPDPPLLPIDSGVVNGVANALSKPSPDSFRSSPDSSQSPSDSSNFPPDSSKHPPDSSNLPPDSSKDPPDSSNHVPNHVPDSPNPPPDTSKPSQEAPDPSPISPNPLPIPTVLPTLTIPLPGHSTLTLDVPSAVTTVLSVATSGVSQALSDFPPAVSTVLSNAPSLVSTVLSDATSVVSTVLSDATSAVSSVLSIATSRVWSPLSDTPPVLSGIATAPPVTSTEITIGSSLASQATQSLESILSGGGSSLGSIVNVTHTILSSLAPASTITPLHTASDSSQSFPISLLSPPLSIFPLPTDGSSNNSIKLPTPDFNAPTTTSIKFIPSSTRLPNHNSIDSPLSPSVGPSSSTLTPTVSRSWPMDSSSITASVSPLSPSVGPSSSTPLTPSVSPSWPMASLSSTALPWQPPVSPSGVLVFTNRSSSIIVSSLPTTLPSSTHLNATSTSISGSSSLSQPVTTGSQGSGSSSTMIPSVTQGSANSVPTPGFFNQPATVVGTFTAVGVVVVAAAVGIIVLTRLRGHHHRRHRIPGSDPDEERVQDNSPMRQRSLQTNTHRSVVSHQSALPLLGDTQVETKAATMRNPPISDYQLLGMSETQAARNSWSKMPSSRSPPSPVDPVDPHGWPIIASGVERNTPSQRPTVSPDPYSGDPDVRAVMGWILADEATLESIPEDYDDSESLLNLGYGTRPIRE